MAIQRLGWTEQELAILHEDDGLTNSDLAMMLGRDISNVSETRRRLRRGESVKMAVFSEDDDEFIREHASEMTIKEMAEILNINYSSVRNRIRMLDREGLIKMKRKGATNVGNRKLLAKTCIKCGLLLDGSWFGYNGRWYQASCTKCKDRLGSMSTAHFNSVKQLATLRRLHMLQERTKALATRNNYPITEDDHAVFSNSDLTVLEKAIITKRTYSAVIANIGRFGYASSPLKYELINGQWQIKFPHNQPEEK